jgi:hypothetical protein
MRLKPLILGLATIALLGCEKPHEEERSDHDPPVQADSTSPERQRQLDEFATHYKLYWRAYCDQSKDQAARDAALASLSELFARTCRMKFDLALDTKGCVETQYITCRSNNPGAYQFTANDAGRTQQ